VIRSAAIVLAVLASPALAFDVTLAGRIEQGGLVVGSAPVGSKVTFGNRTIPTTGSGHFLLGLERDAPAAAELVVTAPDGSTETRTLTIAPRPWQIEKVDGVPQSLVTPDPVLAAKIAAENQLMIAVRAKLELIPFFETGFIRPAEGRISGVFGSQRILNGEPRAPHNGLDIAGPIGTPVRAAADGVVALQKPGMIMTGHTVVLNHGYGLQTVYIHMSKINVTDAQRIKQGDVIGEIGMTGRANGPHLHFGVTWFDTRLDPETVLAVLPAKP
jgi:hypothetical protein